MKKLISKLSTACLERSRKVSCHPFDKLRMTLRILKGQLLARQSFSVGGSTVFIVLFSLFTVQYSLFTSPIYAQPAAVGQIERPPGIPTAGGDVQGFTANLIRNSISLLLIVAFIAAFVWLILAGIKFITSGGDPKAIEAARSQITWGIVGLVVVLSSYAILRVVEIFFRTPLVSGPFQIPR